MEWELCYTPFVADEEPINLTIKRIETLCNGGGKWTSWILEKIQVIRLRGFRDNGNYKYVCFSNFIPEVYML